MVELLMAVILTFVFESSFSGLPSPVALFWSNGRWATPFHPYNLLVHSPPWARLSGGNLGADLVQTCGNLEFFYFSWVMIIRAVKIWHFCPKIILSVLSLLKAFNLYVPWLSKQLGTKWALFPQTQGKKGCWLLGGCLFGGTIWNRRPRHTPAPIVDHLALILPAVTNPK